MPTTPKTMKRVQVTPLQNRPKGAVRAKSGCYTCRIRRKKCDERRVDNETGPCETCLRLKLECLGFGAKRPDWLRDSRRVAEIRDRIKEYLAGQGMIKGHSGSGSLRAPVQDDFLRLSDARGRDINPDHTRDYNTGTSSSGGSPDRDDSIESDQHYHQLAPYQHTSAPRIYAHPYAQPLVMRCDSPNVHPYEFPGQPYYSSPDETPARRSQLSLLYNAQFTIDPEPEDFFLGPSPFITTPTDYVPHTLVNESVREYVNKIVDVQYLLGDNSTLPTMVWNSVINNFQSQEAIKLLALCYHTRQRDQNIPFLQDVSVQQRISDLQTVLTTAHSADDAMAALHIVSLYLFEGGKGRWADFLSFACTYTIYVLRNPQYYSFPEALEGANPKDAFVVKTTIWFDVLASITSRKPPVLLQYIRALFSPNQSWVGGPKSYSMISPMGCENVVVWALAETSYLSWWKAKHTHRGDLSVRQLVSLVQEIEPYLLPGPRPVQPQLTPEDWTRYLASEIFRTSTKLFLKTVESGDFPNVLEIKEGVKETLSAIREFPVGIANKISAVVRSTVFGFYICGSLTDDEDVLRLLEVHLIQHSGHGVENNGIGNTSTISWLLRKLWDERLAQPPGQPVRWRRLLAKEEILLV